MSRYGKFSYEEIDRRNKWNRQEKEKSATQNLARVLGIVDHGSKVGVINMTKERSWLCIG